LLVQQVCHGIEGDANQLESNNNFHHNTSGHTNEGTGSGGIDTDTPYDAYLDPRDWIDDLPTAYADSLPPIADTRPCLLRPRHDEGGKFLTEERRIPSRDEC
jgi:hypothetical protein